MINNEVSKQGNAKAPNFFIPQSYKSNTQKPSANRSTKQVAIIAGGRESKAANASEEITTDPNSGIEGETKDHIISESTDAKKTNSKAHLFASPSGVLDLTHYDYTPANCLQANGIITTNTPPQNPKSEKKKTSNIAEVPDVTLCEPKEKKRSRFRRPRRNSKFDRLIRLLQDKRIGDDEDGEQQLEDLQMPRLRKVLNIIFVTLGICFLLAVIIVIIYTTFASDTEALLAQCNGRNREQESSEIEKVDNANQTEEMTENSRVNESRASTVLQDTNMKDSNTLESNRLQEYESFVPQDPHPQIPPPIPPPIPPVTTTRRNIWWLRPDKI